MKPLPITQETEQKLFFHNYARFPLAVTHGKEYGFSAIMEAVTSI